MFDYETVVSRPYVLESPTLEERVCDINVVNRGEKKENMCWCVSPGGRNIAVRITDRMSECPWAGMEIDRLLPVPRLSYKNHYRKLITRDAFCAIYI